MATGMVGYFARIAGPQVLDSQHLNQKFGEIVDLGGQFLGLAVPVGVLGEQVEIKYPHHGGARARGNYHVLAVLKAMQYPLCQSSGLCSKAGVEKGLTAAGLVRRKIYFHTQLAQDTYNTNPDLWVKLVNDTGGVKGSSGPLGVGQLNLAGAGTVG